MSDFEARAETTQFGIDILYHLVEKYPRAQFFWILGEDQLDQLPYWKEIERYADRLEWIVIPRKQIKTHEGLMSRRLLKTSTSYRWMPLTRLYPASSTVLRQQLLKAGPKSARTLTWLPKTIKDDIVQVYSLNRNQSVTRDQKEKRH